MSAQIGRLDNLYSKVQSLFPLGSHAILRRVLSLLAAEINHVAGAEVRPLCDDGGRDDHPTSDAPDRRAKSKLNYSDVYREIRSEDRRRTIFLDPEEALVGTLLDFYSGRLDSFEVRAPNDETRRQIERAEERAFEILKKRGPMISVVDVASDGDRRELINSLRALAHSLETRGRPSDGAEMPIVGLLGRENCTSIGHEAGSTHWADNGTRLIQVYREVFRCIDEDACCENAAYTKHGPWEPREVWADTGNSDSPPPTNPPPFERYPWNHRCLVFHSPIVATVTSDWGWRTINGSLDFHAGMDLAVPVGTQVRTISDGRIVWINRDGANGERGIIIRTGDEIYQYWHVDPDSNLRLNDPVSFGSIIGATAQHANPHLHFARYRPPDGDWTRKSDSNSLNPCP